MQQTMDKTESDETRNIEQGSVQPKAATASQQAKMKMVHSVFTIWLDDNIDDTNEDCRNTMSQLRRVSSNIHTFTDGDECIEFIAKLDKDSKGYMIISGTLGQQMLPRIHDMSQVDSIFIFCGNKNRYEEWAKEWSKIKDVYTEMKPICDALQQTSQEYEQNTISISFMPKSGGAVKNALNRLDPTFIYLQVIKEILLGSKFDQKHFQDFINYCCDIFDDNQDQLVNIKEFEEKYPDESPIWWYTYDWFLNPMLNRAFRSMDVNMIIKMGFFIVDLHRHIEQLYKEQFDRDRPKQTFTIYRGQGLSKVGFDQLTNAKGGLMSFNNFLSATKNRNMSLSFARNALADSNSMGIVFVMTINLSKLTTPLAFINDVRNLEDKDDEILFSMHSVFCINDVRSMPEDDRLFQVNLTLTDENNKDPRAHIDLIGTETFPDVTGWYRLGLVLYKMGEIQKAGEVYTAMLDETINDREKSAIYSQLGTINREQGKYEEAIAWYEKVLEIYHKTLPANHLKLSHPYDKIGFVYENMGEYSKALSLHKRALEIRQQSLPSNHPDLATSFNNIGSVYYNIREYSKAISYHEKALQIKQKSFPSDHPDLSKDYNNMGLVYEKLGDYTKARSFYEQALNPSQRSLLLIDSDHKENREKPEKKQ